MFFFKTVTSTNLPIADNAIVQWFSFIARRKQFHYRVYLGLRTEVPLKQTSKEETTYPPSDSRFPNLERATSPSVRFAVSQIQIADRMLTAIPEIDRWYCPQLPLLVVCFLSISDKIPIMIGTLVSKDLRSSRSSRSKEKSSWRIITSLKKISTKRKTIKVVMNAIFSD